MGWFWFFLMAAEKEERQNEEDEESSWYGPILCKPTKFDKFMERHKVLDATWPFAAGIAAGLLPILIGAILTNLFCR